eukprot:gene6432-4629_t
MSRASSSVREGSCCFLHLCVCMGAPEHCKNVVKPLLVDVLSGINCCIFAYGQTSSGKSHTMIGPNGGQDIGTMAPDSYGILPRAAQFLLGYLNDKAKDGILSYSVKASFLQIYNENLYDLLRDSGPMFDDRMLNTADGAKETSSARGAHNNNNNELKIREVARPKSLAAVSGVREVYVSGLSEFRVETSDDILHILAVGTTNRMTRSTDFNFTSSRSHAILQLTFEIETQVESGQTLISRSKLNLIDLAGSEKMSTSDEGASYMLNQIAASQKHVKELTSINKSLHALGNVISALSSTNRSHVPYRDSKLTRLLQDSLGGNTRTILIACVAPTTLHTVETLSTLSFADRAKNVKLQLVKANTVIDDKLTLAKAQAEISRLKALLSHALKQLEEEKERRPSLMTLSNRDGASFNPEVEELLQENERLRDENDALRQGKKRRNALDYLAPSPRGGGGGGGGGGGAFGGGRDDFDAPRSVTKAPRKAPTPVKAGFLSRVDRFGYGAQPSATPKTKQSRWNAAARKKRGSVTDDSDASDGEFGARRRRGNGGNVPSSAASHLNSGRGHPHGGGGGGMGGDSVFMQIQQRQRYELNQLLAEANAKLQQQILGHQPTSTSSLNSDRGGAVNTSNMILASGIMRKSTEEGGQLHGILKNTNANVNTSTNQSPSTNNPPSSSNSNSNNNNYTPTSSTVAVYNTVMGNTGTGNGLMMGRGEEVTPTNRVFRKKNQQAQQHHQSSATQAQPSSQYAPPPQQQQQQPQQQQSQASENRPANLTATPDDIGRTVELFSFRQNGWERIDIVDFDPSKRYYKVRYPNQSVQWLDLAKKPVRSLPDEVHA